MVYTIDDRSGAADKDRRRMHMVRGCQRQVIVLRGTGSGMFDEAYFILKPEKTELSAQLMITEANRIVEENRLRGARKSGFGAFVRHRICFFLMGAIVGGGVVALLGLLGA